MDSRLRSVDTDDGQLRAGEIIVPGIQVREGIVSVVVPAPTPVEVEQVLVVVAVAEEGVAAGAVAAVIDRTQVVQLGFDKAEPCVVQVAALVFQVCAAVAEVGVQCVDRHIVVGAAAAGSVHHLHGHAAVVHQLGHFVDLGRRASAIQRQGHEAEVVCGGGEVHTLDAVIAVVAVGAGEVGGVTVAADAA